jgi:DNA polymerase (family X)
LIKDKRFLSEIRSGKSLMSLYFTIEGKTMTKVEFTNVDDISYGAGLLFTTGSGDFNVQLRSYAKIKGYKLNQYGLYLDNEIVASETEEDILKQLGLMYILPEFRVEFYHIKNSFKIKGE